MIGAWKFSSFLCGLLIAGAEVRAEPEAWMKKLRPNELAFELSISNGCPIYAREFEETLLRNYHFTFMRQIPIMPGEPYLSIDIWCEQGAALLPFTIVAQYEQIAEPYARANLLGPSYDASGAGYYRLVQAFESVVREALDDHIAANFDL